MSATQLQPEELAVLRPPRAQVLERLDHRVRLTFAKLPPTAPGHTDPIDLLERSARFLDHRRALAGVTEAIRVSGVRTFEELSARAGEIVGRARLITRIDPLATLQGDPEFVKEAEKAAAQPSCTEPISPEAFERFVRAVSSLVEYCPIDNLIVTGEEVGRPDLGHRCRLAYDWLRAFVRRYSPSSKETLQIIGRAYAEGRLSLDEVAHLTAMPRPDAVAWLEECGYARDLNVIALSEESRADRIARIRTDRQMRGGVPSLDPILVVRDLLASQRIEDVDARAWVTPLE